MVSALGFGCMGLNFGYGHSLDRAEAINIASCSRRARRHLLRHRRGLWPVHERGTRGRGARLRCATRSIIATKFGFEDGDSTKGQDSRPERIRAVCEASLKRLRTDRIDLFYQHRVDTSVPMEDVAGTVKDLIAEGKVLHFGLSEAGVDSIRRAHAVQPVAALQSEYSYVVPRSGAGDPADARGTGHRLRAVRAVGQGLSDRHDGRPGAVPKDDFRSQVPRFSPEARQANQSFVELLLEVATARNATPAQIALAWLLSRKPWIAPIPGTTKLHRLEENLGAVGITLDAAELHRIDDALSHLQVHGDRYPPALAARVGR